MQLATRTQVYISHRDTYRAKGHDECYSVHGMKITLAVWDSVYRFVHLCGVASSLVAPSEVSSSPGDEQDESFKRED